MLYAENDLWFSVFDRQLIQPRNQRHDRDSPVPAVEDRPNRVLPSKARREISLGQGSALPSRYALPPAHATADRDSDAHLHRDARSASAPQLLIP